ncbi:hypothetical protein DL98DRAFT_71959 [Cadophora sp. DSE1049]|nr:hypothetical protein DL98DRAFT_71959 [Cadophora sp. DSE1049]
MFWCELESFSGSVWYSAYPDDDIFRGSEWLIQSSSCEGSVEAVLRDASSCSSEDKLRQATQTTTTSAHCSFSRRYQRFLKNVAAAVLTRWRSLKLRMRSSSSSRKHKSRLPVNSTCLLFWREHISLGLVGSLWSFPSSVDIYLRLGSAHPPQTCPISKQPPENTAQILSAR